MIHELDNQFTISHELLILLRWLILHDEERLRKMVTKALASGLHEELQKINSVPPTQEVQYSITDFFVMLEVLLIDAISEQVNKDAKGQNLMPAIDQIDSTLCDKEIVQFSLEKATTKMAHNPNANPREILYQELLKNWKPHNKSIVN
jgi:hypothetical protein